SAPEKGLPEVNAPSGLFAVYRDKTRTLSRIAAFSGGGATLTGAGLGDPERIDGATVSKEFFGVFGVPPQFGRTFVSGDEVPNNAPTVVVLSHALWQRKFGGDSTVVNR